MLIRTINNTFPYKNCADKEASFPYRVENCAIQMNLLIFVIMSLFIFKVEFKYQQKKAVANIDNPYIEKHHERREYSAKCFKSIESECSVFKYHTKKNIQKKKKIIGKIEFIQENLRGM